MQNNLRDSVLHLQEKNYTVILFQDLVKINLSEIVVGDGSISTDLDNVKRQ